jgi:hypothetical protein
VKSKHTYLTALSPIEYRADDPDRVLAGVRETLRRHEQLASPFRRCAMAHMVRLQVIDQARPPMGAQDAAPLQSSYLLFAAELDGGVDDFLDALYRADAGFVHALWGRCIGYPPYAGPVFLRRYIARCRLRGELPYAAFDASVGQTLRALSLKERFGDWVGETQGLPAAELQRRWVREHGEIARTKPIAPGTF